MNKEEILAMSREENKKKDPLTIEAAHKGATLTIIGTSIFAGVLYLSEMIVTGKQNPALWAVLCIMNCFLSLNNGIRLKQKTSMFAGIIWGILTIASTVSFVMNLAEKAL